jgi:cardiolipin synthase (CMP-forming)
MGALEPGARRDEEPGPPLTGEEDAGPLTVANGLTALRLVLAPVFLVLFVRGDRLRALGAFAAAAATDVLDGLLARALHQRSRVGAVLDPIADKLLGACAVVALAASGALPTWLAVLVLSRDAALFAGALLLKGLHHPVPIAPTRIGKYATAGLAVTVTVALAADFTAVPPATAAAWIAAMGLLTALCVALSFAQYTLFFVRALHTRAHPG